VDELSSSREHFNLSWEIDVTIRKSMPFCKPTRFHSETLLCGETSPHQHASTDPERYFRPFSCGSGNRPPQQRVIVVVQTIASCGWDMDNHFAKFVRTMDEITV
jgi:hypothetical protein